MNSFEQLLATRVGFAAAQATQNPVCFSLIPELFPKSKTTAMAFYNSAIYMGRALSFAAVIVAAQLGIKHSELGVFMVLTLFCLHCNAPSLHHCCHSPPLSQLCLWHKPPTATPCCASGRILGCHQPCTANSNLAALRSWPCAVIQHLDYLDLLCTSGYATS